MNKKIAIKKIDLLDKSSIFDKATGFVKNCTGKIAIMAGHYMLAYSDSENRLFSLVGHLHSRNKHGFDGTVPQKLVTISDFPEQSFDLGLRLQVFSPDGSKIVLLVNDRQFQVFQKNAPTGKVLSALKKAYYRQDEAMPKAFREIMEKHGVDDEAFLHNNAKRHHGTLPANTVFFSENILKNNFEKKRRDEILRNDCFLLKGGGYGRPRIVYLPYHSQEEICFLDEYLGCGCNGTMTELLLVLNAKGFNNMLLIVPDECQHSVGQAIIATMEVLAPSIDHIMMIWADSKPQNDECHHGMNLVTFVGAKIFCRDC